MASFTNQATLSYNNFVTTSNIVAGEIVATLSMTKETVSGQYRAGDTVTYAVSLVNSGNTPYTNVTLTDNLGAYPFDATTLTPLTYVDGSVRYYSNGILQPAPAVTGTQPLQITGITVPANGNVLVLYSAAVNNFAPQTTGSTITNTATATGAAIQTPLTASATTSANVAPNLTVVKSLNPTTVVENEPLTYTFTIQNSGATATTEGDNVVLTDTFNPRLNIQSVTLNGAPLAADQYTYNAATGVFTTNPGAITVPAAEYRQDPTTGAYSVVPGSAVLAVTGII